MSQGTAQSDLYPGTTQRRVDPDAFSDELKPGTELLGGQYTIIGFLNSGGFGITYLAKDSLERTIVIKECFPNAFCRRSSAIVRARSRKHQSEFRDFVQNFVEEAKSLARLVHPNIVGVHQVFEDNDTAYMAIDFINGRDLHDILDTTDRAFTPDEVVVMLKKMLSAVEFIHQVGILHRDISPDNILIDTTGNPVLIDFGAASEQQARATRVLTGRRVVKDGYSPQEFYLTGAEQSPSSDLYSLGATFYHVITGKPPAESQRRLARVAEGEHDPYEPLAGRISGFPPGFLESIDKSVRVMPRERIQSASDWLEMIRVAEESPVTLQEEPIESADPLPPPAAAPREPAQAGSVVSNNMGYIIGAGTVFLAAAVFGLWSMMN